MSHQLSQRPRRIFAMALVAAGILGSSVSSFASQWNYTGADNGLWSSAANWTLNGGATHQVPVNFDDAILGTAFTAGNVTFNANYTGVGLNSLTLDSTGHASITLNQTGASAMIASNEYIGITISANLYNQTAGNNTTSNLYLGFNNGGFGCYTLSGTGSLTSVNEYIGFAAIGGGIFTQSGGANNLTGVIDVGYIGTNASNAYNLSAGAINFTGNGGIIVGDNTGRGTFNQTGGSITMTGSSSGILLGVGAASSPSSYTLSGSAAINGPSAIHVSHGATFTQTGGSITLGSGTYAGNLFVGDVNSGSYTLSAATGTGSLAVNGLYVGTGGTGTFTQSGGTFTSSLWNFGSSGMGTFSISAGTATTGAVFTGITATDMGNIVQTGGTLNVTTAGGTTGILSLGSFVGGTGNYTIDASAGASALNAPTLRLGDSGTGTMTQNGGTVTIAAVLTIGRNAGSVGTYNFNGGNLAAGTGINAANVFVGGSGNGTFNQNGGTFTIGNTSQASLSLGSTGGVGIYNLFAGSLTTSLLQPGNGGTGAFNQSGGAVFATQLNISTTPSSNGTYTLSGAGTVTLNVSNFEAIGASALGTFTQNGGTHTLNGDMQLGENPNGIGVYNLNGGTLTINNGFYIGSGTGSSGFYSINSGTSFIANMYIGNGGPGTVAQNGGSVNVTTLFFGTQFNTVGATGTYTQSAGILTISSVGYLGIGSAPSTYTLSGSGVFNVPNSPNTFNDLFISSNGTFTQSGGTVNGYVFNSGTFNFKGGTFNGTLENGANGLATFNNFVYFGAGLKNHGTLNIPGGQVGTAAGQTLNNDGTITLSASGQIYSNGPVINNGLITGTGSIGGSSTFTNNLTIQQGAGPLTLNFGVGSATNIGTIALASGRALNLFGGITNLGDFQLNGASIIQNGTLANALGGTVSGPGTILSGFSNSGTVLPGAGTLNITTPWTNAGVAELSGLTSALTGGSITNTGTIQGLGSVGSAINNSTGTIESIGGTLVIGGALTNSASGTLTAGSGSKILVSSTFATNAGLINLTGGTFDNGNHPLNNTGQISGFGIFRSGGLTNNGAITFSGTNGSTNTINGPVTNSANQTLNIKYNPAIFTGAIVNNGLIKTTSTTATFTSTFTNNGSYISDPSTNIFSSLNNTGSMSGGPGDVFTLSPGGNLNNSGTFTSSGSLNANGNITNSGTFTQTGPQSWSSTSGFTNTAGLATFGSNAKLANLTVTGGTVNLTTSKFIIEPANKSATLLALQTDANNGSLTASGLAPNLALAIIDNGSLANPFTTFGGLPADSGSILIAPELLGDSNIDGHVDLTDLNTVLNHLGTPSTGWTWGGFDGQPTINLTDLNDVLNNLGTTYANSSTVLAAEALLSAATPTPEPTSLALIAVAALPLLHRRRRPTPF